MFFFSRAPFLNGLLNKNNAYDIILWIKPTIVKLCKVTIHIQFLQLDQSNMVIHCNTLLKIDSGNWCVDFRKGKIKWEEFDTQSTLSINFLISCPFNTFFYLSLFLYKSNIKITQRSKYLYLKKIITIVVKKLADLKIPEFSLKVSFY